jgi:hypothetical protein
MNYIWEGDVTNVLDILKFHAILENLHSWAMRILKPQLLLYIDQWKHHIFPSDDQWNEERLASLILKRGNISVTDLTSLFEVAIRKTHNMGLHHSSGCNHDEVLDSIQNTYRSDMEKHIERLEHVIEAKFSRLKAIQGVQSTISQTETATISLSVPQGTITETTKLHGAQSSTFKVAPSPTPEIPSSLVSVSSPETSERSRKETPTEVSPPEHSGAKAKTSALKEANIFATTGINPPKMPRPPPLFGAGVDNTIRNLDWISASMFNSSAPLSSQTKSASARHGLHDEASQTSKSPPRPLLRTMESIASRGLRNARSESLGGGHAAGNGTVAQATKSIQEMYDKAEEIFKAAEAKFKLTETDSARDEKGEKKEEVGEKSNQKDVGPKEEDDRKKKKVEVVEDEADDECKLFSAIGY